LAKIRSAFLVSIDVARSYFDRSGRAAKSKRLNAMPPCLIGMGACVGAYYYLNRRLQVLGHDARLMRANYVRAYSKGQENDLREAETSAEAGQRSDEIRHTKTADRVDLQALHWGREAQVRQPPASPQIRAFPLEHGIVCARGTAFCAPNCQASPDALSPRMMRLMDACRKRGHDVGVIQFDRRHAPHDLTRISLLRQPDRRGPHARRRITEATAEHAIEM
jgi:transposase